MKPIYDARAWKEARYGLPALSLSRIRLQDSNIEPAGVEALTRIEPWDEGHLASALGAGSDMAALTENFRIREDPVGVGQDLRVAGGTLFL